MNLKYSTIINITLGMKMLLSLLITMLFFILPSCDYYQFVKGVKEDAEISFSKHKAYSYNSTFEGLVTSKETCQTCTINKYSIKIKSNKL
jgi:hypothetical protein